MQNNPIDSRLLLQELSFVVMDLETTGGSHESDQIIEIGLVKIENMEVTEELHYLVNPEVPIPPFVQRLTSLSHRKLAKSPRIEAVIQPILNFIGDSILVAHNVSFDFPFLNSVLTRLGRPPLTNHALCTNLMSQHLIPNILNSNLHYMGKLFHIPHKRAHRALEDAKACALLLLQFLEAFAHKGIRKINQLYYPQAQFKLDRAHFLRKEQKGEFLTTLNRLHLSAVISFKNQRASNSPLFPSKAPTQSRELSPL